MLRQLSLTEMFKNERLLTADLIVMGTHGATGLRGIVGSNTQRIVRQAPMPVLVVKHHIEDFELKDVVFASNRAIDAFLQRHELTKFTATIYNDLSIEEGILNFAKGIDADLIAMATHGRTGFFQVVNGSLTEDIVNHTNFPVLSVKL